MSQSEPDLGFPSKGSLKRIPFASLLRDISQSKSTGSLYLLSGETKKVVFFVDGRPTVVRSNLATEFLGQILTDQGLITQEQCDNTLEAIRRTGKKQGELLVEMGILSEGNLRYGLEEQLRIKLFELFTWDEGRFQFKLGAEPGNSGTPPAGTTESLILAAIQERFDDERARTALRAWGDKYPAQNPKWSGDVAALGLLPEELYFLKCLDGSRTTDELVTRKLDLEVPQVSTLLLGLISAGVVDPLEAKMPRRLAPVRPNLAPPNVSDEQLAPGSDFSSSIGEYEDTPLPSRLTDLGASSSKNPRVPILPTEDEEMFRGLNVDESIVTDTRSLRAGIKLPKPGVRVEATPAPTPPAPAPSFDDESDFSDLRADAAADRDDAMPTAQKPDSGKHKLGALPGLASLLRKDTPKPAAAPTAPPSAPRPVSIPTPTPIPAPVPALLRPLAPQPAAEPDDELPDLDGDLPDLGDIGDEIEELDDDMMLEDEVGDEALPGDDASAGDEALPGDEEPPYPTLDGEAAVSMSGAQVLGDEDEPDLAAGQGGDDDIELPGDDGDDLADVDDLDDVDLAGDIDLAGDLPDDLPDLGEDLPDDLGEDLPDDLGEDIDDLGDEPAPESTFTGGELDAAPDGMDAYAATRYAEADAAMREGDFDTAVALLEDAYNAGYDVPELHAHLAFARYRSSGGDPDVSQASLDLLDYVDSVDPGLAIAHAYRGVILVGLGAMDQARECFERALEFDPYCELALEYRDSV